MIYKPKHDSYVIDEVREALKIINAKPRTAYIIVTGDSNQGNVDWENNTIAFNNQFCSVFTTEDKTYIPD